jgi:uncharacterized membrane protein (DUF2068 family)
MFEDLNPDPGQQGLEKAGRIFYIVAVLNLLAIPITFVAYGHQPVVFSLIASFFYVLMALLSFVTARGIEGQKKWAKWLGIVMAILSLPNFPVGTIIGIVTLVYMNRASKAGLLSQ